MNRSDCNLKATCGLLKRLPTRSPAQEAALKILEAEASEKGISLTPFVDPDQLKTFFEIGLVQLANPGYHLPSFMVGFSMALVFMKLSCGDVSPEEAPNTFEQTDYIVTRALNEVVEG